MPWSNQDSGGREPGGLQQGPDLADLLKAKQRKLKPMMPGGSGIPGAIPIIAAIVLAVTVVSFAFTFRVYPDEMGVVMRFGKVTRQEPPGLHFRMPYPIDEVRLPKVTRQNIVAIGRVTRGLADVGAVREGSMTLTGDENIVDVALVVLWRIEDAVQYLFNIQNPDTTVQEVAESATREVVGQSDLQPILTSARQKTEQAVLKLMQDVLDRYGAGIRVERVQLLKADPPAQVIDAFRNVQAAATDKETSAEPGVCLRRPGGSGSTRRSRSHPAAGQGLSAAGGRRSDGAVGTLCEGRRRIQEGAGGDAQAPLPRNHGAHVQRCRQDYHR